MRALLPGLSKTTSIQIIDLSANRIDDSDLDWLVCKLIRNQKTLKNEIKWKAALRDELPVYETCRSLKVLNLSHNRISCKGIEMMADELKDDEHMRSLVLRANCIGTKGVKTVRKLLKQNNSLFSVDLRGNQGLCPKLNREIAISLLENYTRAGQYILKGYGEPAWLQE